MFIYVKISTNSTEQILFVVSLFVGAFASVLILSRFIIVNVVPIEQSIIDEYARTLISPSVTISVLFISIVPTVTFFYLNELKETSEGIIEDLKSSIKEHYNQPEECHLIDVEITYLNTFHHNVRSGLLRYIQTYILISIISIITLILIYITLPSNIFIVLMLFILIVIFGGILPIFNIIFYRPYLKPTYQIHIDEIIEKIDYE